MTNWQFIFAMVGVVIAIFGASWLNTHQIDKRFDEMNKRLEEMGKRFNAQIEALERRFDAQFEVLRSEIRRLEDRIVIIEEDIREIKADLKRLFKPITPN